MFKIFLFVGIIFSPSSGGVIKVVSDIITGKPPCLTQCVGLVKPNWQLAVAQSDHYAAAAARADISECGFVSPPILNANVLCPFGKFKTSDEINPISKTMFGYYVYFEHYSDTVQRASQSWEISWTATGYVC